MTARMFILTRGERRQDTAETFRHLNPTIITHDERSADRIQSETGLTAWVSGVHPGLRGKVEQQRWLFQNHVEPNEWVIVADDNVTGVQGVRPRERDYWERQRPGRSLYTALRAPLTPEQWAETLPATLQRADHIGARLVGFASSANPLSRTRRWGTCAFVWGKLTIWKAEPDYPWDGSITVLDDYCNTALHLERRGVVLVDYQTYMDGKRYAPGGLGVHAERAESREQDIAYLMSRFPGLFRSRRKPSGEHDLVINRNRTTIQAWRRDHITRMRQRIGITP